MYSHVGLYLYLHVVKFTLILQISQMQGAAQVKFQTQP